MATETLRPISNINTAWADFNYTKVDEVVTQPSAGDGSVLTIEDGDAGLEQQWTLTTPSGTSGNVTSVDIWILARTQNESDDLQANITCKIRSNGTWYTAASSTGIDTNDVSYTWYMITITNSMGAIATMSPAVGILANTVDKLCPLNIDTVYVNVNYSVATPSAYAVGLLLDL